MAGPGRTGKRQEPVTVTIFTKEMPAYQVLRDWVTPGVFSRAVGRAAQGIARTWRADIEASAAKTGFKRRYQQSIRVEQVGPFKARISAEGKFVSFVEKGIRAFDMKPGLLNGPRARMSQDGYPYNIIAFRHGSPGAEGISPMSVETYREVRAIPQDQRMVRIGMGRRKNVHGDWVAQATYRPGYGRSEGGPSPETAGQGKWYQHQHRTGKESGMVRAGGSGHSQYLTFRVVSAKSRSRSWRYPGIPAVPIFPGVNKQASDIIQKSFLRSIFGEAAVRGAEGGS